MSRSNSKPFFNTTRRGASTPKLNFMSDKDFNALHWEKQLELRPLRDRKRYEYAEGDRNTRLDQDWEETTNEDKETT